MPRTIQTNSLGEAKGREVSKMSNQISQSITVGVPVDQAYAIWSDFTQFPQFMNHVKSVERISDEMSHWVVRGPAGVDLEWTAVLTVADPGKRIAWNTKNLDGDLTTSGQVTFNQLSPQETEVTVTMQYVAPGGKLGEWAAEIVAQPQQSVKEDLRRFKEFAETPRRPEFSL